MRRVIYIISGPGHLPNLVVSLLTLRKHYNGQVDVFVWPESEGIVKQICHDQYLDAGYIPWKPLFHGHSDTYVDKTRLIPSIETKDAVLFLDADTTIHSRLDVLFDGIELYGFVATQFNDWVSTGGTISRRIKSLLEFPEIDKELVDAALAKSWPSVNSGIFGAAPDSPVNKLWHQWTYAARTSFIPDEKVLHLMLPQFGPSNQIMVAVGGRWNCSPNYQPRDLADKDVVVWHYHGDCNLRPDKSPKGAAQWWLLFDHCMRWNVGHIREWIAQVNNKHLKKLLTTKEKEASNV